MFLYLNCSSFFYRCLTLNNYPADWKTRFAQVDCLAYWIVGEEVAASGTPHLQGYLQVRNLIFAWLFPLSNCFLVLCGVVDETDEEEASTDEISWSGDDTSSGECEWEPREQSGVLQEGVKPKSYAVLLTELNFILVEANALRDRVMSILVTLRND